MNGKTATLLRKVAHQKANSDKQRKGILNGLKRMWYDLNRHERADKRKELQAELED